MSRRTFIMLVVAIAVMSAILVSKRTDDHQRDTKFLLPALGDELNDITKLSITGAGNRPVATLTRGAERWAVAERDGYPADIGKIRDVLIALANATVVEEKTADPALYARLGVEDIADENATGMKIVIEGPTEPYRVIIGRTGVRGDHAYARNPDSAVSLLIAARLDLGAEPTDWLDRAIIDIPSHDVFRVTTTHPDGETIRIEKSGPDASGFELVDQPADTEPAPTGAANSIGSVLADLTLDDVAARTATDLPDVQPIVTRFETFDGLVISASIYTGEDRNFVAFEVSIDAELAQRFAEDDEDEEASDTASTRTDELNDRLGGWLFVLPDYKRDQLTRHLSDLMN